MTTETLEDRIAQAVEARLRPLLDTIAAAAASKPAAIEAPAPEDERFLDIPEAAKLFGCHRTTILRYEEAGTLPPRRKVGARTGWLLSELKDALRNLPQNRRRRAASH